MEGNQEASNPAPIGFVDPPPPYSPSPTPPAMPQPQPPPQPPPQPLPQQTTTTVVYQPAPSSTTNVVVMSAGCPSCKSGVLTEEFTLCGICLAIWCFPLGLICCFLMRRTRCTNCRAVYS